MNHRIRFQAQMTLNRFFTSHLVGHLQAVQDMEMFTPVQPITECNILGRCPLSALISPNHCDRPNCPTRFQNAPLGTPQPCVEKYWSVSWIFLQGPSSITYPFLSIFNSAFSMCCLSSILFHNKIKTKHLLSTQY